jgi:outer membrane receptor protein involved in Fe transport
VRGEFEVTDIVSLFAGIDNLTDEAPPFGRNGTAGGEPWDAIGRYYYGGFRINL